MLPLLQNTLLSLYSGKCFFNFRAFRGSPFIIKIKKGSDRSSRSLQLFLRYKRFLLHVLSLSVNIFRTLSSVYTTQISQRPVQSRQTGLFLLVDIYNTHDVCRSRRLMSFRIINDSCSYDRDIACFYNTFSFKMSILFSIRVSVDSLFAWNGVTPQ